MMRHGESAANAENLITGFANVPLTKVGRRQARRAGKMLSLHYDAAFSSNLFRARETLQLALKARKLDVLCNESPLLAERQLGELELQLNRHIPEYANGNLLYAPGGGESYYSVTRRVLHFLFEVAQWIKNEWHQEHRKIRRILVCTHMGPMRVMIGILNEDSDPTRVLARSYDPAHVSTYHWTKVSYPRFIGVPADKHPTTAN